MRHDDSAHEPPGSAGAGFQGDAKATRGLTIRLFGGMSIEDSRGAQFLPRSRKTRAVVAILALTAPRSMPRMQMTALLWSRREKEQARASLRQAVHELQEALGPTWSRVFNAERHALSMDLRDVTVDALACADPAASAGDLPRLLKDGFLEELNGLDPALDDWLASERRRLAAACLSAEAAPRDRDTGDASVEIARSLSRLDPANATAWQTVVQGLLGAGDRTGAEQAPRQWPDAAAYAPGQPPPPALAVLTAGLAAGLPTGLPAGLPAGPEAAVPEPAAAPAPFRIRSSLRLGVREMRAIGGDVDRAFTAGLAEEITLALSRFRWISCVSASSLAAIADDAGQAAARWSGDDLDLILDGTIQRVGPKVRVAARLMDMRAGGEVLWANRFDRCAADVLSLQDEVAALIVAQAESVLLMREGARAAARTIPSLSPRELVLRAVPAVYRLDRLSFHAAGEMLEAALAAEPRNVDALAWYAYWHLFSVGQGWATDAEAATVRAAALADTAVSLDPSDARALTLAGHVRGFLMKRASEAMVLHDRAISLNPNLAIAWCFSGFALSYLGDHDEAIVRMRQAIQLSPSDPHRFFFQMAIMMPYLLRGEYQKAAMAGREAVELNPWFSSSFKGYLAVLGHLGDTAEAATVLARLLKLEPGFTVRDAIRRSPMNRPADVEAYATGLRRAGLPEG